MSLALPRGRARHIGNRRFKSLRAIGALVMREMSTTYGRSPGGYLWAIAEPVAGIALLSIVFGLIARSPPIGDNFPIFYATGFLPFGLYRELELKIAKSIRMSGFSDLVRPRAAISRSMEAIRRLLNGVRTPFERSVPSGCMKL